MTKLRFRKIVRDMWTMRYRTAAMIVAIAVSVVAIGTVLSAKAILSREIARNYLGTHPASATLEVHGGVKHASADLVRSVPGVSSVALRGSVQARMRVGAGRWQTLMLFIVGENDPRTVSGFDIEVGTWPPAQDSLLLERSSISYFNVHRGESIIVETPNGKPQRMRVAGAVHDPGVAPSFQETVGYGYLTPKGIKRLGRSSLFDELKIIVGDSNGPEARFERIEEVAQAAGALLNASGDHVEHIEVPPPLRHPHQSQMNTVTLMLLIFSVASLVLSAVLVATMLNAALVRQVSEIGVMKAIGGRTEQILVIYLTTTASIAVLATALALGPSVVLGRLLSRAMAGLLNVDLASTAIPWWVSVVQVATGILIPLVIAFVPLQRGSSVTVRTAIDESGFSGARSGAPRFDALMARLGGTNRSLLMSLRSAFRRRGRLALAVTLLAAAGTTFFAAVNSAVGWTQMVNDGLAHRHYDIEIKLDRPARATKLTQLVAQVNGVSEVEAWASKRVEAYRAGEIDVERTYPDRAHGGFAITAIPPSSRLLKLAVLKGRWLRAGDTNAVVLNQLVVPLQLRNAEIGSETLLSVDGRPTRWQVVGMVSDFGTPATAYVTPRGFAKVDPTPGGAELIRVVTARHDAATQLAVLEEIETKLASAGEPVRTAVPVSQLKAGLDGHVMVLVDLLLALAIVMAVVGLLGLASTLSASVIERTREFGIMRSIGATPAAIRGMVVAEGIVITAISIVLAIFLSLPLTSLLGSFIGNLAFRLPLPFESSFAAICIWAVAVTAGATAAAAIPARAAGRLTIRESLAHT